MTVAPAGRLLTVVHQRDDTRPAEPRPLPESQRDAKRYWAPTSNDGWTRCGQPMLVEETWIDVPLSAAPLCPLCRAGESPEQDGLF